MNFNDASWLVSPDILLDGLSAAEGTLISLGSTQETGRDELGAFKASVFSWGESEDSDEVFRTTIKAYPDDDEGVLVFEQYFPLGRGEAPTTTMSARSLFPAFSTNVSGAPATDCFSYHGVFPAMESCTLSTYKESHQGGAPFVLYDGSDPTLPMVILSPLSSPKAYHMAVSDNGSLFGAGIKATATSVPAGFTQRFLLSAAFGINAGMDAWGSRLRKVTGRARTDMYVDEAHSTIGFWCVLKLLLVYCILIPPLLRPTITHDYSRSLALTFGRSVRTDNGGYYHYETGSNSTYEDVLPQVKAYHDSIGVPFRHWQFDSWFYPKDGDVSPGGGGGAVTNWTSLDSVFPSGMAAIQDRLQVPMVMHNRQWSIISDYIENLDFKWYSSEAAAVMQDPAAFFTWFFQQQEGWGLSMYEQDWCVCHVSLDDLLPALKWSLACTR